MRLIDADAFRDYVLKGKPIGLTICEYSESDILYMIKQQPTIAPPPNDPLTLEELREMDGEPVWVVDGDCGYYALIGCVYETCIWITSKYDADYCLMFSGYGADWLAYRRKPEEGTT